MKLIQADQENLQFEMAHPEKFLLQQVLQCYPLVPATYHRLSKQKSDSNHEENQRLLEEALQAQRQEHRQQIEALLNDAKRFEVCAAGYEVRFSRVEMEWLLQVINDVRIGSWIAAGSPSPKAEPNPPPTKQTMMMEFAAYFEMCFLRALDGGKSSEHD